MFPLILTTFMLAGGGVGQTYMYACNKRELVAVTFEDGYVQLQSIDGDRTLIQGVSASGARFTDGRMVFWVRGRKATWDKGDGTRLDCRVTDRG